MSGCFLSRNRYGLNTELVEALFSAVLCGQHPDPVTVHSDRVFPLCTHTAVSHGYGPAVLFGDGINVASGNDGFDSNDEPALYSSTRVLHPSANIWRILALG